MPYAGLGYQSSEVAITHKDKMYFGEALSSKKTDAMMWKAGIMIFPAEEISLMAEMKQSFNTKDGKGFNQYLFGFSYKLYKL